MPVAFDRDADEAQLTCAVVIARVNTEVVVYAPGCSVATLAISAPRLDRNFSGSNAGGLLILGSCISVSLCVR
jgi:hypothetical protein